MAGKGGRGAAVLGALRVGSRGRSSNKIFLSTILEAIASTESSD